jgi:hypothetical protein
MRLSFNEFVGSLFGGELDKGSHTPESRQACALEAHHAWRGAPWSDLPDLLPDLRPINDGPWSSSRLLTEHLVPVVEALDGWAEWPPSQRCQVAARIAIETVREIASNLPDLPDDVRQACRTADNTASAASAARAAADAAADADAFARTTTSAAAASAAWAAAHAATNAADAGDADADDAAAYVAATAARAAAHAAAAHAEGAADAVLITACRIWREAAEAGGHSVGSHMTRQVSMTEQAHGAHRLYLWVTTELEAHILEAGGWLRICAHPCYPTSVLMAWPGLTGEGGR